MHGAENLSSLFLRLLSCGEGNRILLVVVAQIRQLLFPGVPNMKHDKGSLELQRTFKVSSFHTSTAAACLLQ